MSRPDWLFPYGISPLALNTRWIVGLMVETYSDCSCGLKAKTLDGTYWKVASGTREEMERLMREAVDGTA